MSWEIFSIAEVCSEIIDCLNRTAPKVDSSTGYKMIRTSNIKNGRIDLDNVFHVDYEIYKKWTRRGKPQIDDIILTREAPVGEVGIVRTEDNIFLGQRTMMYRTNTKIAAPKFLYYSFLGEFIQNQIHSFSSGSTVAHVRVPDAKAFSVLLPPLPTQKKIASILSAYDDLIENNLKRIKLLEEAAQNIYKEWFVNFRFPGWENAKFDEETGLPEGWKQSTIIECLDHYIGGGWGKESEQDDFNQIAYVIRGTDMPNVQKGDISEIPIRYHKPNNLKSRKLVSNDIVFEVSGGSEKYPVGRSILINDIFLSSLEEENAMCASFCKLMRPKSEVISPFILSGYLDELYRDGTIAQYENRSASNIVNFKFELFIERQKVSIPPPKLQYDYEKIIEPLFTLRTTIGKQNQKLKEARDILLPRLMNQTINV